MSSVCTHECSFCVTFTVDTTRPLPEHLVQGLTSSRPRYHVNRTAEDLKQGYRNACPLARIIHEHPLLSLPLKWINDHRVRTLNLWAECEFAGPHSDELNELGIPGVIHNIGLWDSKTEQYDEDAGPSGSWVVLRVFVVEGELLPLQHGPKGEYCRPLNKDLRGETKIVTRRARQAG